MPGKNVRQFKLRQMSLAPETTIGTAISVSASPSPWVQLPILTGTITASEGSRIIDRSANADGFAGSAESAIGSFAYAVAFEAEIHGQANTDVPLFVRWLGMTGHNCVGDSGAGTYTCTPSTLPLANYPAAPTPYDTTIPPHAETGVAVFLDGDTGNVDSYTRATSVVGTHTFTLPSNSDRPTFGFTGLGYITDGDALVTTGVDLQAFATKITGRPVAFRGATISIQTVGGTAYDGVELKSFVFTQGANVRATEAPQNQWGFTTPSVFQDAGATVSFQLANTIGDEAKAWVDWRGGAFLAVTITLDLGTCTLALNLPRLELQDVTESDDGGARALTYNAKCTRPNGSSTPSYTYTLTDTP
jgi:hypothetical protein